MPIPNMYATAHFSTLAIFFDSPSSTNLLLCHQCLSLSWPSLASNPTFAVPRE
jgi:hypothetical protein